MEAQIRLLSQSQPTLGTGWKTAGSGDDRPAEGQPVLRRQQFDDVSQL